MRYISIDLSSDNYSVQPQIFAGYAGEHNETVLQVVLPNRMIGIEYLDYYFDFQTSEDNKISIPVSKLENDVLSCHLTEQLTVAGKLLFNVVAHKINGNSVSLTSKTNMVVLYIGDSPDGNSILPNPDGYKDEILTMIDARILEINPAKVDQIYKPNSDNAQSGIAVAEAINSTKKDIYNSFSNSLKSTKSGAVITADDVSPLEHNLKVKLTSDTVTDFSGVSVTRKGMNFFNPAENFDASYKDYVSLDDDVFTMSTPQAQLYINTDKTVVTPAGKYTITLFPLEDYSDFNVFVYFYNKDGGEISISSGTIGTDFGTYSYTFTAYEDFILSIGGAYGHLYSGERKFRVMLEEGAVDNSKYSVFVEPQTVVANKYGTVEGLTSASPMTLYSDNDEVIIHCEYNKDINSFKGGAAVEVDQVYDPVSSNAQSGKAVNGAIKEVQANTNNQISQLDKKINTIASTGLTRQIVEVLPEATPETSTTTIYMIPDEEATENNAYKEYLFCKTWSFIDSGTTYVYGLEVDGENLSGVALPDITSGLITDMDTFSSDNDRPIYRKVTLVGDRFGENSTITVTDTAFGFIGEAALIALHESKNTALDFFPSETWEEVLEDDEMYAYGYRHKISCYVQVYREATVPELIGSTKVDLTDYYTKSEIDEQIGDIDSALDELHAYAQALVSGGATE